MLEQPWPRWSEEEIREGASEIQVMICVSLIQSIYIQSFPLIIGHPSLSPFSLFLFLSPLSLFLSCITGEWKEKRDY